MKQGLSIEGIIKNYQLLGDPDFEVREQANLYLLGVIDYDQVWKITQKMIVSSQSPDFQLLGAQILYQKVQRDLDQLQPNECSQLRQFLFTQLLNESFSLPTVRKIASSASLIALSLFLDSWQSFITDMVSFMEKSELQLRNGLVVFERLPQELRQTNRIRHGVKMLIKQKLIEQANLIKSVYTAALGLGKQSLTQICLQGIQNWVLVGFPLMKYSQMVYILLQLMRTDQLYLQSICKILKDCLQHSARSKYQSISQSQFMIERDKYSPQELESLSMILSYLQTSKNSIFLAIQANQNSQAIQIFTGIVKEILLSYGFLLKEDIGFQLVQIVFRVVQSNDLKLSYSTFEFWIDFCQKLSKMQVGTHQLSHKFMQIIQHLFDILLSKTKLDLQTLMSQNLKDEDTIDDLSKVTPSEYRKEAAHLIKFIFDYFGAKKQQEGSLAFFRKVIEAAQKEKNNNSLIVGLEESIYVVKSALESMVREYDTVNILDYLSYLLSHLQPLGPLPPKLSSECLSLIQNTNRQVKQRQSLFLSCLSFCLKNIPNDLVSHYAVYAFQSLMQSVNQVENDLLVKQLMQFYQKMQVNKDNVMEKVLQGILVVVGKMSDRQQMGHYLQRVALNVQRKYQQQHQPNQQQPFTANYLALLEIKTLLDSFDHFRGSDQQHFRPLFLKICSYGIALTTNLIRHYLQNNIKFTSVGDLGTSLSIIRNSLRVCQGARVSQIRVQGYVHLMEVVMSIYRGSIKQFNQYSSLNQVIVKVYTQFVGQNIQPLNIWLANTLPTISAFFWNYLKTVPLSKIDPDHLKHFFSVQQAALLYSREVYLGQPQHQNIYRLALQGLEHVNQKVLQRKVVSFLLQCVQMRDVYPGNKLEESIRVLFRNIPNIHNICHLNLARMLFILFEPVESRNKNTIIRQLLQYEPYTSLTGDMKELMTKFVVFGLQSKVDRFMKGVINDLTELRWKANSSDAGLHLQIRYTKWKKEYAQMIKNGTIPQ